MKNLQKFSALTAYVLAGVCLFLLFPFLTKGLTYDELYSAASASHLLPFSTIWKDILLQDINTPLYNILLYLWLFIAPSQNEIWLRLPSLLCAFGTLTILWFALPKKLTHLHRLIFFCLLCTNGSFMYYARETRCYSLLLLLSTALVFIAISFGEKIIRKENISLKMYAGFSALGIAACYTHYFGAALFFALVIILVSYRFLYKQTMIPFLLCGAITLLAFSPWLYHIYSSHMESVSQTWWIKTTLPGLLLHLIGMFFKNLFIFASILALCIIGGRIIYKQEGTTGLLKPTLLIPFACILLVFFVAVLISQQINVLYPRYFIPIFPAVFLLVSQLLGAVITRDKYLIVLVPLFQLSIMVPYTLKYYFHPSRGLNQTKRSVEFLSKTLNADSFFLYLKDFNFPPKAVDLMIRYYIEPTGLSEQMIILDDAEKLKEQFKKTRFVNIWVPVIQHKKVESLRQNYPIQVLDINYKLQIVLVAPQEAHD